MMTVKYFVIRHIVFGVATLRKRSVQDKLNVHFELISYRHILCVIKITVNQGLFSRSVSLVCQMFCLKSKLGIHFFVMISPIVKPF
jgi:hypothetical protein